MIGLGTIINSAAIVAGGVIGHITGRLFRQEQQDALTMACGISVLFIAIAGAMQGMLHIDNGNLTCRQMVTCCKSQGTAFIGRNDIVFFVQMVLNVGTNVLQ